MVLWFYIFLVTGDVVCLHGLVFNGKCPVDKSLTHSFWLGVLILLMNYPRQFSFLLWCFQLVFPFDTVLFPSLCSFFPSALAGGLLVSPQHDRLLYKEKKDYWVWCLCFIGMVGTSAWLWRELHTWCYAMVGVSVGGRDFLAWPEALVSQSLS